jgi:hypothetical protein
MDGRGPLTSDAAFLKLKAYFDQHGADINIHQLFNQDPERFNKFQ